MFVANSFVAQGSQGRCDYTAGHRIDKAWPYETTTVPETLSWRPSEP